MSKTLRAHLLALKDALVGTHKIYNLGNGFGYSVSEVVEAVRRLTGDRVKIVGVPAVSEMRPPSWLQREDKGRVELKPRQAEP